MFRKILTGYALVIMLTSVTWSGNVSAGAFTDDFSSGTVQAENWGHPGFHRRIEGGKLISKYGQSSVSEHYSRHRIRSRDDLGTRLDLIEALINVKDIAFANNSEAVFARIEGYFYRTVASPSGLEGLVWAALYIGDRGSGMEAWGKIEESGDGNFTPGNTTTTPVEFNNSGFTPSIVKGQEYSVSIVYDGNQGFTFTLADSDKTSNKFEEVVSGPARVDDSQRSGGRLTTGADFTDGGDGSEAFVGATFDDATLAWDAINHVFTDTFSSLGLDRTNWQEDLGQAIVEVVPGPLVMKAEAAGDERRYTNNMEPADLLQDCLYAELAINPATSVPNSDHRGRVRVNGFWYNDMGPPYNGKQGDVYAHITLDISNGQPKVGIYAERVNDPGDTDWTDLGASHTFATVPVVGKTYPMFIELDKTSKKLNFGFNGEVYGYDIATGIHAVSEEERWKSLLVRVEDTTNPKNEAEGTMVADIFKVVSDTVCPRELDVNDGDILDFLQAIISGANKG